MSYATPFYYAAKALATDEPIPHTLPQLRQRRRRIRLVLFPAQRLHRPQAKAAAAASDC